MPPLPGEERLLTVFADVHYYFSAPTPKPLHHRFDKASYVYLYHNATQHKTRIEVANNPGTPEQDAFHGSLGNVYLQNTPKFPTCLTVVVDPHGPVAAETSPDQSDEWRLPSADPRDEGKFLFRLHTLDIYFWTPEDAALFLSSTKKLLSPTQLEGTRAPPLLGEPPRLEDTISPVVKQLETVAITDPAYSHGQTRNSRSESTTQPPAPPAPVGPTTVSPAPMAPHTSQPPAPDVPATTGTDQANYAPLAYNPSAPPAPEPIKHREKTPPPPDAVDGTGLAAANAVDHNQGFAPPPTQAPGGFAPPPPVNPAQGYTPPVGGHVGHAPPPPPAGLAHTHSASISSHSSTPQHSNVPGFAPPPPSALTPPTSSTPASHPAPMTFAPPPQDPNAHIYAQQGLQSPGLPGMQPSVQPTIQSPGLPTYGTPYQPGAPQQQPHQQHHYQPQYADYLQNQTPPPPQQPQQQQMPLGGYANYTYDQTQTHHPVGDPSLHSQVYRPTEAEANTPHFKQVQRAATTSFGEKTGRVEKGVNRFLKKLDKKL